MKRPQAITAIVIALSLALVPITEAKASECSEPTLAPSSQQPTLITIIDTEIGTEAFERLVTYSSGGHRSLGIAIAQAHQWFAVCEYVGVGIGSGSGGNGYRPNFMLALWRDGIDTALARSAVYQLVGASSNPVVTTGDCNISCDGTVGRQFDGSIATTTTLAPTTTTVPVPETVSEPVVSEAPTTTTVLVVETAEPVADSEPVVTETATTTTTTTTVLVVESAGAPALTVTPALQKSVTNKKPPTKKPVTKKSPPKKKVRSGR